VHSQPYLLHSYVPYLYIYVRCETTRPPDEYMVMSYAYTVYMVYVMMGARLYVVHAIEECVWSSSLPGHAGRGYSIIILKYCYARERRVRTVRTTAAAVITNRFAGAEYVFPSSDFWFCFYTYTHITVPILYRQSALLVCVCVRVCEQCVTGVMWCDDDDDERTVMVRCTVVFDIGGEKNI